MPILTHDKVVAIVDPYEAGAMYAREFGRRGYTCLSVESRGETPVQYREQMRPQDYAEVIAHRGDVAETAARVRERRASLVVAGSEWGVNLADELSAALGLPSNGTQLSDARRHKCRMQERVRGCGLRVAPYICSGVAEEVLSWCRTTGSWPKVLKPPHSMSSEGVSLCHTEAEVAEALRNVLGRRNKLGLMNESALVQDFVEGTEYVVDTVSYDGVHRAAGFWRYGKTETPPDQFGRFDTKDLLPCDGAVQRELFAYTARVLDALGIRYGPAHCELMWTGDGPVLVEIGARAHGGVNAHLLSRAATGSSQIDLTVEAYTRPEDFLSRAGSGYRLRQRALMVLLRPARRGRLKALNRVEEIERLPSFHALHLDAKLGEPAPRVAGLALLMHAEESVIREDLRRIRRLERDGLYSIEDGASCATATDAPQSSPLIFDVLTEAAHVEALAAEWNTLLERSTCNRAFSSPTWYGAACGLDAQASPHVIVARREGALVGILPLVLTQGRTIEFPGSLTDYNDIIVARDDVEAAAALLRFALARGRAGGEYDQLVLRCLRTDSNCLRALRTTRAGRDTERWLDGRRVPCPFIRLASSHDDYLKSRRLKFRSNLMRAERRAASCGVGVRELVPQEFDAEQLPAAFLSLHLGRFSPRSCFDAAPAQRFVERAFPRLFEEGRVRVFALFEREKMLGIHVSMTGVKSLCSWNAGFLPGTEHLSPGKLLFHAQIKQAFAAGLEEYDLLRGAEAYKSDWATDVREIRQLTLPVCELIS